MVKSFISRDVNQNISQKKITYELSFLLFPVLSSRSFPLGAPVFPLLENFSYNLASQAGVFRGAPYFVPPHFLGRDERRAPLKTPAWEATYNRIKKSVQNKLHNSADQNTFI